MASMSFAATFSVLRNSSRDASTCGGLHRIKRSTLDGFLCSSAARRATKTSANYGPMPHANMSHMSPVPHHHMDMGHRHVGNCHAAMVTDFRNRFWVSMTLTVPILALSPLVQDLFSLRERLAFWGESYVLFGLSAVVYLYCGLPFLKGIHDELTARQPGMMTLIAVAISTAFFYSSAVVSVFPAPCSSGS